MDHGLEQGGSETCVLVDDQDRVVGTAPREACHRDPGLMHRTVHVVVMNRRGEVLLQRRSMRKDVCPGRWDTAVGGHVRPGEDHEEAARRELREELGLEGLPLGWVGRMKVETPWETELVGVFITVHDGPFSPDPEEIEELRFWKKEEVETSVGDDRVTPGLAREISLLKRCGYW
ncbi:NUDIX hydrolase [Spirochaeta thermophila]|uniref:Nudix hydrolase 3 n=1 Tax=Winmispira thermophila (strain ATCC 49972 / DSM 6192 / RI 19.B1) TaxID=665571 RepID=E0RQS4_WINT6|nr:NUDIX domain-containing protein [Spirochaeta thermophila]ADN02980.1 nudix hydrolase 3 [Spirochaeta thermophila DSM 6192]